MNKTKKDISAHIDSLPEELRQDIKHLDKVISEIMVGHYAYGQVASSSDPLVM